MKNLKISMKLLVGFGVTVLLIFAVSLVSIISLSRIDGSYSAGIENHAVPLNTAVSVVSALQGMRSDSRGCIIFSGNKDRMREMRASMDRNRQIFKDSAEVFRKALVKPEVKKMFEDAMDKFKNHFEPAIYKLADEGDKGVAASEMLELMLGTAKPYGDTIADLFDKATTIKAGQLADASTECSSLANTVRITMIILLIVSVVVAVILGFYISAIISKPLTTTVNMINEMSKGHLDMRLRLDRTDEIGMMARTMDMFADDLQNVVVGTMKKISDGDLEVKIELKDSRDEVNAALRNTVESLHALIIDDGGKVLLAAANKDLSQRLTREYKGDYAKMKDNINTVVQNLDTAMGQVSEAVAQVTSASGEISSGAQNLAESSNEQASSLEEVSSSLEEMSSMTKQNADNSNQAKILASEARTAADEGDSSMKRMAEAIRQIKTSSDNTAKIVKSIDDIAFQTNLLALNAAVEAARAGEAGKGFAVVAEEVRNLAMRSAEAAKNTANMIEESVKNADGGVKITEEVAKSLGQIVDRTGKVGDLIAEIAAASNEQALGIEQVNTAVAQMNQVTQSNAANSEESASAAEELSSQASELANMVGTFKLSAGSGNMQQRHGGYSARRSLPPPPPPRRVAAALPDKTKSKGQTATAPKSTKAVKAEDLIPLDDDELNEF
jgi:methyl-accepting chemotaxis protein